MSQKIFLMNFPLTLKLVDKVNNINKRINDQYYLHIMHNITKHECESISN